LLLIYISHLLVHHGIDLRVYQVIRIDCTRSIPWWREYVEEPGQYRGGGEDGICRREARINPI
jgi:hypothetical protein